LQQRVEKLRELMLRSGIDALLIMRPENRIYLSGFKGTNGAILMNNENAYLLTDFRYIEQAKEESPHFQIRQITNRPEKVLSNFINSDKIKTLGFEGDYLTYEQFRTIKRELGGVEIKPVAGLVESLRAVKDKYEINLLRHSAKICDDTFKHILGYLKPGVCEKDIALEMEFFMRRLGADTISFPTIVASGVRSALPHGTASEKKLNSGDLVTIDFGAVYKGYYSDMTRTIVLGRASKKQKEIYRIVLEAQEKGIAALRAGVPAAVIDKDARGLIEKYGYGECFGHSLGHGVGLTVHEEPHINYKNQKKLQPGMVVTVEPGIYINGWGGVRIEDMAVVNEKDFTLLTTSPKKELLEIG